MTQEIKFCIASDGTRLAYAKVGQGPPLVKAANWLSHLEYDWNSPVWRPWLEALSRCHTLYRYDERGCGLSDWDVADISLDGWVRDLETVVDAAGLDRFPLFGMSQGGPIAIAYAARHPERVSRLVLYGTFVRGWRLRDLAPAEREEIELQLKLTEIGWGIDNPAFRQVFTSYFLPEGTPEQIRWFNELMRTSASPKNAVRLQMAFFETDVREIAPTLNIPTLVLHAKGDAALAFEEGRLTAAHIPGARFVPLEGKNHLMLSTDPDWPRLWDEIYRFLGIEPDELPTTPKDATTPASKDILFAELSARERDVLRLLAKGYQNEEIAQTLVLSPKTVRNYVSNIYAKLQVNNRSEAIILTRRTGFVDDTR
jgi:pimeloyl-ACP methyl ester carboxylesterase/DNA-binding CsgD family transcriptional regulator